MKRLLATRLAGLELPPARGRLSVGADGAILFRTPPPAEAQGGAGPATLLGTTVLHAWSPTGGRR